MNPPVAPIRIPAGECRTVDFNVDDVYGFYVVEVHVLQERAGRLDDVFVSMMDRENFLKWETMRQIAAAPTPAGPVLQTIFSGTLHWGSVTLQPSAVGKHYLVLDNGHSRVTAKTVTVAAHWFPNESPTVMEVRVSLTRLRWEDIWTLLERAQQELQENRTPAACGYMRTALATLWKRVAERGSGQKAVFDPGKATDVSQLQKLTEPY